MKNLFKFFSLFSLVAASVIFTLVFLGDKVYPDTIHLLENQEINVNGIYSLQNCESESKVLSANSAHTVSDGSESAESYQVNISLLNTIPVKSSTVTVSKRQYVVPSGDVFGIKIFTDGILIVGMDDVPTAEGIVSPAKRAGLKVGDVILAINGCSAQNVSQLSAAVQASTDSITLTVRRDKKVWQTQLSLAVSSNDGTQKAGLWVRDSTAGVGTMTFYCKENGIFGGLGHAICDLDTGAVMPFGHGEAIKTQISGCYKGSVGITGELCGVFEEESLGTLYSNGETGVFGVLDAYNDSASEMPVATKNEVKTGYAQILAMVDDAGPQYYDAKIVKVYPNSDENGKNMIVEVTDSALIEKTGGIVQGMSGSPIIQNGMLVGAVTHVFVNNALQGYGIFAETMLKDAEAINEQMLKAAS